MNNSVQNMRAGGTIKVSRFVVPDTTANNSAIQASNGNTLPLGIATNAGRLNPDPNYSQSSVDQAAIANENVGIHGPGSTGVDLYCAFAWSPGDLLMPDSNGEGVVATAGQYYGARAQTAGVVGALCPVDVVTGLVRTP